MRQMIDNATADAEVLALFEQAVSAMAAAGARIHEDFRIRGNSLGDRDWDGRTNAWCAATCICKFYTAHPCGLSLLWRQVGGPGMRGALPVGLGLGSSALCPAAGAGARCTGLGAAGKWEDLGCVALFRQV